MPSYPPEAAGPAAETLKQMAAQHQSNEFTGPYGAYRYDSYSENMTQRSPGFGAAGYNVPPYLNQQAGSNAYAYGPQVSSTLHAGSGCSGADARRSAHAHARRCVRHEQCPSFQQQQLDDVIISATAAATRQDAVQRRHERRKWRRAARDDVTEPARAPGEPGWCAHVANTIDAIRSQQLHERHSRTVHQHALLRHAPTTTPTTLATWSPRSHDGRDVGAGEDEAVSSREDVSATSAADATTTTDERGRDATSAATHTTATTTTTTTATTVCQTAPTTCHTTTPSRLQVSKLHQHAITQPCTTHPQLCLTQQPIGA